MFLYHSLTSILYLLYIQVYRKHRGYEAMGQMQPAKLRKLSMKDLDAVTEIDYKLLGTERRAYWEEKIQLTETSAVPSLAAEVDGKMIGFILGRASRGRRC